MADIVIRGMEIPKNCSSCKIICWNYLEYGINGILRKLSTSESRDPNCPLVPPEPPAEKANETPSKPKRERQRKPEKTNKSHKPFADYRWGDCQGEEGGPRQGSCEMGEA